MIMPAELVHSTLNSKKQLEIKTLRAIPLLPADSWSAAAARAVGSSSTR